MCEQDPIASIAPKKPNWDLRRDNEAKLQKLERRTQKALVSLMCRVNSVKTEVQAFVPLIYPSLPFPDEEEKRRQMEAGEQEVS